MNVDFNPNNEYIAIPNSKGKIILLIIVAIIFVIGGLWLIIDPSTFEHSGLFYRPNWETQTVGYTTIIIFGACVLMGMFLFFTNKPGLVIDKNGVTIKPGSVTSLVKWGDIEKFDIKYVSQTALILIYIKNPKEYIEHQKSPWKRKLMLFNYKTDGSLLAIATGTLKCSFDELYSLLNYKLNEYNKEFLY